MHRIKGIFFIMFSLVIFSNFSFSAPKTKVLHPKMGPLEGNWDAPHSKVGEKPKGVWSAETVNAAVNKKPLQGKVVTRVGEIIDVSCYLQLGKHGKEHAACAKSCIMNGAPIGLLDADGNVYVLIAEEHDARRDGKTELNQALINHIANIVEVTGTFTNVKGMKAIYVQGFVKKE